MKEGGHSLLLTEMDVSYSSYLRSISGMLQSSHRSGTAISLPFHMSYPLDLQPSSTSNIPNISLTHLKSYEYLQPMVWRETVISIQGEL